ncbi:cytochrome P450 2K1-like [Acipenser oxyrinchus oxyrinchus]|uniref:Cytochrome P450 2K1-like n=1 Tax=Acipenser oxyrinchus oxyrinchus TaxID=40147 RepID=A0AAD8CP86_ACIOX|nr:cytochrome P450 2K1-like [Acipenser oxyrinchus oxyrinchus]
MGNPMRDPSGGEVIFTPLTDRVGFLPKSLPSPAVPRRLEGTPGHNYPVAAHVLAPPRPQPCYPIDLVSFQVRAPFCPVWLAESPPAEPGHAMLASSQRVLPDPLSETYGNVFTFHMGPKKYVVLTGYEAVKEALVTKADDFSERGQTHITDNISRGGKGGVLEGDASIHPLHSAGLWDGKKTIEYRIIEESQRLVEVFQSYKGKPFDPQIIINSAVSNIICSMMFGDRFFDYSDTQFLNLQRILNGIVRSDCEPQDTARCCCCMAIATQTGAERKLAYIEEESVPSMERTSEPLNCKTVLGKELPSRGRVKRPGLREPSSSGYGHANIDVLSTLQLLKYCTPPPGSSSGLHSVTGLLSAFIHQPKVDPTVTPVIQPLRRIPLALRDQLYNMFPFLGFFLSDHKKVQANRTMLQEYFRNAYKDRKDTVDSNDLRSFIDTFISRQRVEDARNPIKYFHEDNMAVTAMDLFAAGTETTSTTLRWGLLLMMKNPHIQDKVQEEIESVIGRERPPQAEDRKSMPYMDAVLHEIQRVGNLVPMNLLHETREDTTFRGYRIPKGTPVIPLLSSVLSDKTQWETPHQFNPNHFLDSQGKFVKRDAFMPFSAGRRVCLGETLAKMELFLFFTMLLQKFHFRPPQEVSPEQLDLTPTLASPPAPALPTMCPEPLRDPLSETYGNVFTFHMGPKKYVVLTGYEVVKEALVTQADDFSERGQTHTTNTSSRGGNGVIFGKGESWKVMRRFTLSTLRDFGMGKKTIEDQIIEESQRLVEGTPVIPLLSSVLSDKTQWETPHQFNPNHFLDAQGKFVKRDAFMPFSAGRRVCLGETLAKMELFLFFTMLLQKFHFHPPQEVSPEKLDLTPTPGITSGPQPFQLCALSH